MHQLAHLLWWPQQKYPLLSMSAYINMTLSDMKSTKTATEREEMVNEFK